MSLEICFQWWENILYIKYILHIMCVCVCVCVYMLCFESNVVLLSFL